MKYSFLHKLSFVTLALFLLNIPFTLADTAASRGEKVEHPPGDEPMAHPPGMSKQLIYSIPDEGIQLMRISDLIGLAVKNSEGKSIGKVDDVVIENYSPFFEKGGASQKATEYRAIISSGKFLGLGKKLIAVPFDQLKVERQKGNEVLIFSAGNEQIKKLPEFKYPELQ